MNKLDKFLNPYETKIDCINAIKNGEKFEDSKFDLFRENKDVIIAVVSHNYWNYKKIDKSFLGDIDIVKIILKNIDIYSDISEELQNNIEMQKLAITINPKAFRKIKNKNDEITNFAIDRFKENIFYADDRFIENNEKKLFEILENYSPKLKDVGDKLKNNKNIVLTLVKENGEELMYASEILQKDKDVVMAAVKNNGKSLQFVSNDLRNDKDFIYELVKNECKKFFPYVSSQVKKWSDNSVIKFVKKYEAIKNNQNICALLDADNIKENNKINKI